MGEILNVCLQAAQAAGDFLKVNFGKEIAAIETKPDHSLATNLDKEAERIISERIGKAFPDHGILGEEGTSAEGSPKGEEREYLWIIDPLDGTHNFIRGIELFGVSIGVVHRDEFIAGVIYLPVQGELYSAEKGKGAFKNGHPIRVSAVKQLEEATIIVDSNLREDQPIKFDALGKLAQKAFNIRILGSSVRNLTYLAEGKIDAIVEFNDKPWDFAGGTCILREAGGTITAFNGEPLHYTKNGYVAGNRFIHPQVLALCNQKSR